MEMLPWIIYFAGISDSLKTTAVFISVVLVICLIALYRVLFEIFSGGAEYKTELDDKIMKAGLKFGKFGFFSLIFFIVVYNLVPNEKTIYAIAGTYGAVQIVQSPEAKELMDKSLKVIGQKLDEMTKPTATEEKEGK